jgi:OOP family OmpA-OmpF porin
MSPRVKLLLSVAGYSLVCAVALARHRYDADASVGAPQARAPLPSCAQSPSLSLRLEGGRPVIAGSLPDASARENVHARAVSLYGADGFDDHLTTSSSLRQTGWVSLAPTLLTLFQRLRGEASLSVREHTMVVAGVTASDAERAAVLQAMRAAAPGEVELVDQLVVSYANAPAPVEAPVATGVSAPAAAAPVEPPATAPAEAPAEAPAVVPAVVPAEAPAAAPSEAPAAAPVTAPPTGSLQAMLDAALEGYPFEFLPASSVLTRANNDHLEAVASVLRQWPESVVAVEGHTDNTASPGISRDLGARQAAAVVRALMLRGVTRRQVRALGVGSERPIDDNATPEGRRRNRRVSLRVVSGG